YLTESLLINQTSPSFFTADEEFNELCFEFGLELDEIARSGGYHAPGILKKQCGQDLRVPLTYTVFQQYCGRLFILKHPCTSP
uniref:Phenylalanine--tRNA ligase beta subunit B1 domain-containing protein n=1 Tax=Athene cunicularia TaxID=194338 RepID=A0A663N3N0_ATHCN